MMAKRRGLGRGLDALLGSGEEVAQDGQPLTPMQVGDNELLHSLDVGCLQRGKYQPRREIQQEALEQLADSIRAQGILQPLVVRSVSEGRYEIIAGERRWRAAQLAGLNSVPAVIREVSDEAAVAMALIENIQREDLNPVEEAIALQRLQQEFDLTHQQVAQAVGRSRTAVSNLLRLLQLPEPIKLLLEQGKLEMGHARCLLTLPHEQACALAETSVACEWTVRQIEAAARRAQEAGVAEEVDSKPVDPDIQRLEDGLTDHLGVPVKLQHGSGGKGRLVLKYSSLDELDGILDHLRYESR